MKCLIKSSILPAMCLLLLDELTSDVSANTGVTAVSESYHTLELYLRVRNEDYPSRRDPALIGPRTRQRICQDITESGFFRWKFLHPLAMSRRTYRKLRQPRYSDIFHQLYTRRKSKNLLKKVLRPYKYTNSFAQREFVVADPFNSAKLFHIKEQVFACLLKSWLRDEVLLYYVSKEYNTFGEPYRPGRFVFEKTRSSYYVLLAEEPATAYLRVSYNVELYYLAKRRRRQPAISEHLDPVCTAMPRSTLNNQSNRLCVQVLRSSYFRKEITYPMPWLTSRCFKKEVSFRTERGRRKAAGRSYYEFMIRCDSTRTGSRSREAISFYISRAYKPNQVFVYRIIEEEDGTEKAFLVNLSNNVSVTDQLYEYISDDIE